MVALTALDDTRSKVAGLDAGADDYLTKPFSLEELAARVRARIRARSDEAGALKAGPLTVDPVAHRAVLGGREVPLSARELALLAAFVRNTGQVLSRSQLLDMVWDIDFDPGSNVVEVYVAALRRKLGAGSINHLSAASGYRFSAPGRSPGQPTRRRRRSPSASARRQLLFFVGSADRGRSPRRRPVAPRRCDHRSG